MPLEPSGKHTYLQGGFQHMWALSPKSLIIDHLYSVCLVILDQITPSPISVKREKRVFNVLLCFETPQQCTLRRICPVIQVGVGVAVGSWTWREFFNVATLRTSADVSVPGFASRKGSPEMCWFLRAELKCKRVDERSVGSEEERLPRRVLLWEGTAGRQEEGDLRAEQTNLGHGGGSGWWPVAFLSLSNAGALSVHLTQQPHFKIRKLSIRPVRVLAGGRGDPVAGRSRI